MDREEVDLSFGKVIVCVCVCVYVIVIEPLGERQVCLCVQMLLSQVCTAMGDAEGQVMDALWFEAWSLHCNNTMCVLDVCAVCYILLRVVQQCLHFPPNICSLFHSSSLSLLLCLSLSLSLSLSLCCWVLSDIL